MVDALITFSEGEDILASEANQNNQFLLSKLSDNAAQLTTYVEEEITSMQSNVASVQATLQANIDGVASVANDLANNLFNKISPNYSAGVSIPSGWSATSNGWIYITHYTDRDHNSTTAKVNNAIVFQAGDSGTWSANLRASAFFPIAKGEVFTVTTKNASWSATFYKCKGA